MLQFTGAEKIKKDVGVNGKGHSEKRKVDPDIVGKGDRKNGKKTKV